VYFMESSLNILGVKYYFLNIGVKNVNMHIIHRDKIFSK
jgi:hypothetical protein